MFGWLTERRRKHLLETPFPDGWTEAIDDNVQLVGRLDLEQRKHLRDLVQVFVAEKHWEGCNGLELTEPMQAIIAAQACLLLLAREHALFSDVDSILVYPDAMEQPVRPIGVFEQSGRVVHEGTGLLGEAHLRGPVLLAWDNVLSGAQGNGARNVVIHELAHKIDMVDGAADGTPPLDSGAERRRWAEVCSQHFLALRERSEQGQSTFLRAYGATNEAEFFAVATEVYFTKGTELREHMPDLHALLRAFFRYELT